MARIHSIHIYPVKSCKGCDVERALLTPTGLQHDRHWVIIRPDGTFVTQRQIPRLALIATSLTQERLTLSMEGQDALPVAWSLAGNPCMVTVWNDRVRAIDQGDQAAAWLTAAMGTPLRLARFDSSEQRVSDRHWTPGFPVLNQFSDDFQLLITSNTSLSDLNGRLGQPLPMNRFRPNIVIDGLVAFEEDYLTALVRDEVRLWIIKPAARCEVTMTDQATASVGVEPLRTLSTYRIDERIQGGIAFGVHAAAVRGQGQWISVGEQFEEEWNFG